VFVHGFIHNLRVAWEMPLLARYYRRLASFSRLILFDRRGCGLSDRIADVPTLELRMEDIRTVMDAAGSSRAAIFGSSEGGPTAALFAATHPERTTALIRYGTYAKGSWAPDYPWGTKPEDLEREILEDEVSWGTAEYADRLAREIAPTQADEESFRHWWLDWMRLSLTPAAVTQLDRMSSKSTSAMCSPSSRFRHWSCTRKGTGSMKGGTSPIASREPPSSSCPGPSTQHSLERPT
jgi:pimeloyl-ACP methyl ester carboxylesterase